MQVIEIPSLNLILSFVPLLLVLGIFICWGLNFRELLWAGFRMILQLVGVGYLLTLIFSQDKIFWTVMIMVIMISVSAWISLRSIKELRLKFYKWALLSQMLGATPVLFWVIWLVIPDIPWYEPRFIIPLAGMIYSNSMNTMGIAAERFYREIQIHDGFEARRRALSAAFIPMINTFMAVGLVSLPGVMSGQILSGVDPLIAVRYQMVVITMVMAAGGLSTFFFLNFVDKK